MKSTRFTMEYLEGFANMEETAGPNEVFVIATGTAPHTDSVDMDLLLKFMNSQPTKNFFVFFFDDRDSRIEDVSDNVYPSYLGNLPFVGAEEPLDEQSTRQETVRKLKTLQAFGESCPVQEGTIWNTLKRAALNFPELYIYNCAWWNRPNGIQQNTYYENMCELANIFASHPNAFILTNVRHDFNVFSQSEPISKNLFRTPKPGYFRQNLIKFKSSGGRKRTRRGLQKRRASRRWKHRS